MNKLMSAQEANKLSSKNNQEVSISLAMKWLQDNIEDACNDGEFEVTTGIDNWSLLTNMNGYEVKKRLEMLGYKVEDYYEDIIDSFTISRFKKIRISWGEEDESK